MAEHLLDALCANDRILALLSAGTRLVSRARRWNASAAVAVELYAASGTTDLVATVGCVGCWKWISEGAPGRVFELYLFEPLRVRHGIAFAASGCLEGTYDT
jgi:hypothetical protein